MNALLSFKSKNRSSSDKRNPDPLMDSEIYLDESTELAGMSTLKFLDVKREIERKADAKSEQPATSNTDRNSSAVPATTSQCHTSGNAISTQADTSGNAFTAQTAAVQAHIPARAASAAASESAKPSRLQLFKQRVSEERTSAIALPFSQTRAWPAIRIAALADNDAALKPLSLLSARAPQIQATATTSTAPHSGARFCLTRSHDNLLTLLSEMLASSSIDKPLSLQLPATDTFDFCAGAAELFSAAGTPRAHQLVEEDQTRTLHIAAPQRLALDSLTATHPLRQRAPEESAFSGWFTEDGFECEAGVSPAETFVQAELLHLHQQAQRTLTQLKRLAAHLHAHCPHLSPAMALHDTAQADAWLAQHGSAPQPALYRLLECTLRDGQPDETVYQRLTDKRGSSLRFCDIRWPQRPASLMLIEQLAELADIADDENITAHTIERLAVLDVLIRKPAGEQGDIRVTLAHPADENTIHDLLESIRQRFSGLQLELRSRGLA